MDPLRLLLCSDIHGSEDALSMLAQVARSEEVDAVIVCGDFTTYGSDKFVRKFLGSFEARVLAVPGNCDTRDTVALLEEKDASIHDARVRLGGWTFFGYGGGPVTHVGMPFEVKEKDIADSLRRNGIKGGVMVVHAPPLGFNDGTRLGKSMGLAGISAAVRDVKPRAVFSGHIHEARGWESADGVDYVNPGPAREGCYALVELGQQVRAELSKGDVTKKSRLKTF